MFKPSIALFFSLLCAASGIAYSRQRPGFGDCPATVHARRAMPRLAFDERSRRYRSAIEDAVRGPANFAGHYILAQWGCGASCIMAAAVDTQSGRVTSLPFTVSDWPLDVTEPLTYRANSCMVVVQGSRNESKEHGTYYYAFDGKTFRLRAAIAQTKPSDKR